MSKPEFNTGCVMSDGKNAPTQTLDITIDDAEVLSESQRFLLHLRKAEREIRWLRAVGMTSWLVVLLIYGYEFSLSTIWFVYAVGVIYTVWAFLSASKTKKIKRTAIITTIFDPVIATAICFETHGINSIFYVFFYFTLLATAFRFGIKALFGVLGLNSLLTAFLFIYVKNPVPSLEDLLITIFYLCNVTALAAMMSGWVQENIGLVLRQTRSLSVASQRMRMLLHRLLNVEEEERRNISHVLHDSMSGRLFNMKMGLEHLNDSPDIGQETRIRIKELTKELDGCTNDVRTVMNELQPTVLEELGFYEAAGEYLSKVSDMVSFNMSVHIDSRLRSWRSLDDACLFRILQEAILNIRKYAEAKEVRVSLLKNADEVLLVISDDGVGFDPNNVPIGHYGLIGVRERVSSLNGNLTIESDHIKGGTNIIVSLPRKN